MLQTMIGPTFIQILEDLYRSLKFYIMHVIKMVNITHTPGNLSE